MDEIERRYLLTGWYMAGRVRVSVERRTDSLKQARARAQTFTSEAHVPPIQKHDLTLYDQEEGEKIPLE